MGRKIDDQETSWLELLNRLQSVSITIAVFVLIIPCLYRIEQHSKNAATKAQVEQLTNELNELEQAIKQRMKEPKEWNNHIKAITDH